MQQSRLGLLRKGDNRVAVPRRRLQRNQKLEINYLG
jgi:hypothetical protein